MHMGNDGLPVHNTGDPMEIDFDFDSLAWADELDHSFADIDVDLDLGLNSHRSPQHQPAEGGAGFPLDYLFAEDEGAFPNFIHEHIPDDTHIMADVHMQSADVPAMASYPHAGTDMDEKSQRLRNQLSLLSQGSCGDQLVFKNCDASKAVLLHTLTIDLGLSYSHDATCGEVTITRVGPDTTGPVTRIKAPPPSLSRSFAGVELVDNHLSSVSSSALVVSSSRLSDRTISLLDSASSSDKGSQLTRRSSRSQRITESISRHVSTWKSSMSKGGRRGPLTEDGRRDMKILEGAGGACWRCKILRRKVSCKSLFLWPFFFFFFADSSMTV